MSSLYFRVCGGAGSNQERRGYGMSFKKSSVRCDVHINYLCPSGDVRFAQFRPGQLMFTERRV